MKQTLFLAGLLVVSFACNTEKTTEMITTPLTYSFLVGTYTDDTSQGLNQLDFTPSENKLEVRIIYPGIQSPSFVIANHAGDRVFTLEEINNVPGGNVISFSRTSGEKSLTKLSEVPSFGDHPCHISLSPNEKFLTVSNYSGGSFSAYRIDEKARLTHLQTIKHEGSSVNKDRQNSPHVHSTTFSPDGKFLLVADLGTDELSVYDFDSEAKEPFTLNNAYKVTPGDGPRHLVFSPDGKEILLVQEMTATLEILSFDEGRISSKQRISLKADDYAGSVGAAEIRLSPDGKNIYVSNRGDANSLTIFAKKDEGNYGLIQQTTSGGLMPRNFNLTADGKYLLSANQASNDIVVFERDLETGKLTQTSLKVELNKPVYLFRLEN
ncbi:6-phosphogluconolactonase (cycloisomerase 2 family) [Algoriphagus ratkowskyi]|uniref:6-phosphogluconolactonase (Cycloisomerase 2 family) n=1 Tax=Algoriphagus ratkowskyi TaxID=57028 RepID=A0A2W7S3G2_9BACT|nr:lactonase family protein [Algoriphagus ratkowskyi]PZX57635.1 6-phosphogluconolactonase (cycloisomerase 2 family) [Algoriphagus ratkowskyi]TXD78906.1 lactonase family protein [Algoriphagus ratkowskyi]